MPSGSTSTHIACRNPAPNLAKLSSEAEKLRRNLHLALLTRSRRSYNFPLHCTRKCRLPTLITFGAQTQFSFDSRIGGPSDVFEKNRVYARLLTGLAMALAMAGPSASQAPGRPLRLPRTTKINRQTVGLFARSSPIDAFTPIHGCITYQTIPIGGPCAHSEFPRHLGKKERCSRHDSRRRHATCRGFPASPIDAHNAGWARAKDPKDG